MTVFLLSELAATSSESRSFCWLHRVGFVEQWRHQSVQFQRDQQDKYHYVTTLSKVHISMVLLTCMLKVASSTGLTPRLKHFIALLLLFSGTSWRSLRVASQATCSMEQDTLSSITLKEEGSLALSPDLISLCEQSQTMASSSSWLTGYVRYLMMQCRLFLLHGVFICACELHVWRYVTFQELPPSEAAL